MKPFPTLARRRFLSICLATGASCALPLAAQAPPEPTPLPAQPPPPLRCGEAPRFAVTLHGSRSRLAAAPAFPEQPFCPEEA